MKLALSSLIITFHALSAAAASYPPNLFQGPYTNTPVTAGQVTALKWTNPYGKKVNLNLCHEVRNSLVCGSITKDLANTGEYNWTVPTNVVSNQLYAVQLVDQDNPDFISYTPAFYIGGGTTTLSASTTATATSTARPSHGTGVAVEPAIGHGVMAAVALLAAL